MAETPTEGRVYSNTSSMTSLPKKIVMLVLNCQMLYLGRTRTDRRFDFIWSQVFIKSLFYHRNRLILLLHYQELTLRDWKRKAVAYGRFEKDVQATNENWIDCA